MSITDELRKYANRFKNSHDAWSGIGDDLTAIADRIDAEHQKALDEWKAEHGQMWLKGYSECHAELLEGNETLASDLERCGWIRLPKDADGEYIHVGDVMEWPDGETFDVIGIGDGVLFYTESECDGPAEWTGASTKRHYHAPTVEDVLREFALKVAGKECMTMRSDLVDEYAAKLQLKEGA